MLRHGHPAARAPSIHELFTRAAAHVVRDEIAAAEALYLEALETAQLEAGPDSPQLVPILEALAGLLWYSERHDEARECANRAIELKLPRQPGSGLVH